MTNTILNLMEERRKVKTRNLGEN